MFLWCVINPLNKIKGNINFKMVYSKYLRLLNYINEIDKFKIILFFFIIAFHFGILFTTARTFVTPVDMFKFSAAFRTE